MISQKTLQENPEEYFEEDYQNAVRFYQKKYDQLHDIIAANNADEKVVLSIAFPELIRYSIWKDLLETKANELLYVRKGTPTSNFSIGRFQLKPSFAEKLEQYIRQDSMLSQRFQNIYHYDISSVRKRRRERLERLKSYKWQIRYLAVFTQIVRHKFGLGEKLSTSHEIRFMSSALNHDFMCDSVEVVKWISVKSFPYGMNHDNPFTYSEVARFFYKNDYESVKDHSWFPFF